MWGLFYYVFLIIVIALRGWGAIVGNRPPLKNLLFAWTPFRCLFFYVRAFLLCFSHYNFALAEGGGERARLGVCPSLKNEEKKYVLLYEGPFATFSPCAVFCHVVHHGGSPFANFFLCWKPFLFLWRGGFFLLAPPTKTSAFYFCE